MSSTRPNAMIWNRESWDYQVDKMSVPSYHDIMSKQKEMSKVYCNRTLNLRAIRAVGYDMDYTLVHYHVEEWERRSFHHLKQKLLGRGWLVEGFEFDPEAFQRGLFIDKQEGNIVKANQFGYVKRASHGMRMFDFDEQRKAYAEVIVDPLDGRFVFLNTLFSISKASMYAQLVDLLDTGQLPGIMGYADLYDILSTSTGEAHMEGQLKSEIILDPERFVDLDPETPQALLDQHNAGDKLLLITNSEWTYTNSVMSYTFDRFLPGAMKWKNLFDVVIVSARKPSFFLSTQPFFEVVSEDGLLNPVVGTPGTGKILLGGHAAMVEEMLGLKAAQILFVGDHAYDDVHVSKNVRRWRTALIIRELEEEVRALEVFRPRQQRLTGLMEEKVNLESRQAQLRLLIQRRKEGTPGAELDRIKKTLLKLDERITPIAREASELRNKRWGLMMRTGNDKSYMARMVERHADIYTSRVSNLVHETPYAFFRAYRGAMPHDDGEQPEMERFNESQ